LDELGIPRVEQDDHRAGGFSHGLVDQFERMLRALAEPAERDVWSLAGGHSAYVFDLDLAGDHLVSRRGHDRCDESEAILRSLAIGTRR